jgi:UDP-glucose 4-epimerase
LAHFLVTGGCGFIGSHLVDALIAAGHRVRILDDLSSGKRANVPAAAEVVVGDVTDSAAVRGAINGADGCFHLAAIASVARANADWLGTHRVNLAGAITVLDAARARRTPVVYASSAAVYGDNPDVPLTEDAVTRPLSAYGADKLGCELHGRVAWHVHRVPNTGVRLFNIYGPRQDPRSPYSGVISIFADRVRQGAPIEIHGDGGQTRDFVFVGDAVAHLVAAMGKVGEAAVYNVCTGRATSVGALADAIEAAAGKRVERRTIAARAGDIRASIGNPARARAGLGVAAQMPLADGLKATLKSLG